MGHGIAQITAMTGYEVLAIEANDAALKTGIVRCSLSLLCLLIFTSALILYDFSLSHEVVAERFVHDQFSSFLQLISPTSSLLICWIFFCLLCFSLSSPVYFKTPSLLFYIISFFFCVYLLRSLVLHFLSFANSSLLLFRVSTLRIESSLSKALAKEVSKGKISEVRRRTNS